MASERNRVALPKVERGYGVQLPPEKHCLTGVGWGLKDEWDSEEDEDEAMPEQANGVAGTGKDDETMGEAEEEDDDDEGAGRMEDVFGEEGGEEGGDTAMAEG